MKRELGILRPLALGLLAGLTSWLVGAGAAQGQPDQVFPREADQDCSDHMTATIPVDAAIARSKVPPEFDLLLTPDGSAVLLFAVKICTWNLAEGRVAATKELHALIEVVGPFQVIPVPGAPVTLPSRYVYRLFFEGEAPGWAIGELLRFGLIKGGLVQQLEIQPFAPVRTGSVIENGTGGQGYRWTEYTTPVGPVQFGQTNFFYDDPEDARPWRMVSEAAQLYNLVGQGMIVLETDPGSRLGDFGPVLIGQTGDVSPMTLHVIEHIE